MKFHGKFNKFPAVQSFHTDRLPKIKLHQQQPIVVVPYWLSCHKSLLFVQTYTKKTKQPLFIMRKIGS